MRNLILMFWQSKNSGKLFCSVILLMICKSIEYSKCLLFQMFITIKITANINCDSIKNIHWRLLFPWVTWHLNGKKYIGDYELGVLFHPMVNIYKILHFKWWGSTWIYMKQLLAFLFYFKDQMCCKLSITYTPGYLQERLISVTSIFFIFSK